MRNKDQSRQINVSTVEYTVERLKFLLKVSDKYEQFKYFNDQVIKPAIKEINEKTSVKIISVDKLREGRQVKGLAFRFIDQKMDEQQISVARLSKSGDFVPSQEQINKLPKARKMGYESLVQVGVKPGIAFQQIIPEIKGSELQGFEDKFVEFALEYIRRKANNFNGGVIVNWWLKKQTFDPQSEFGAVWASITEEVILFKREMQQKQKEAWSNRMLAREMSAAEFDAVTGGA